MQCPKAHLQYAKPISTPNKVKERITCFPRFTCASLSSQHCCITKEKQSNVTSSRLVQGLPTTTVDLMLTHSKMCTAFIMHTYFPITHAHSLGTRLGRSGQQSGKALKMQCSSAVFIVSAAMKCQNTPRRLGSARWST
jgi:hypothetical protein